MIKKEVIAQIVLDFQKGKLPELIERELKVDLKVPLRRATVILGPRRSGKTYYFYCLIKKLLDKKVKKERILYLNFEDPKLVDLSFKDLPVILEVFYEIYPDNKNQKVWLFFDEIQNVKGWEIFIRNVLDKENASVFVCGSSSKLLSREIATSLRGRTLNYLILPFSFSEFLRTKGFTYKKYLSSGERAKLLNLFWHYFSWGGYPETIIYPKQQKKIIDEIIEVTIYRDLIERHKIRNVKVVKLMFNYLVKAKEFSVHKFYNFLKSLNVKISKNSLYNYLEFFNDAFVFFSLKKFSPSLKKIEQSIAKIYSVDNAFITNIVGDDKSKKFENLFFLSLLRKGFEPNKDVFYYSLANGEVDFLIKKRRKVISLFQVCFDISDYETKEREIKALIRASQELRCNDLTLINQDLEKEEKIKNKRIKFIPLWKFLLT